MLENCAIYKYNQNLYIFLHINTLSVSNKYRWRPFLIDILKVRDSKYSRGRAQMESSFLKYVNMHDYLLVLKCR